MKEILAIVSSNPGLRIREIAGRLNTSNFLVSKALYEMKAKGMVYSRYIARHENADFYDIWFKTP